MKNWVWFGSAVIGGVACAAAVIYIAKKRKSITEFIYVGKVSKLTVFPVKSMKGVSFIFTFLYHLSHFPFFFKINFYYLSLIFIFLVFVVYLTPSNDALRRHQTAQRGKMDCNLCILLIAARKRSVKKVTGLIEFFKSFFQRKTDSAFYKLSSAI